MLKKCAKCKESKLKSQFYKDKRAGDGLQPHCRDCHKAYNQKEEYKQTQKAYRASEHGKKVRKAYEASVEGKQARKRVNDKQRIKNPVKIKAQRAVRDAIAAGKLPKAKSLDCVMCGGQALDYHHESYAPNDWLKVVPYCRMCHITRHAYLNQGE